MEAGSSPSVIDPAIAGGPRKVDAAPAWRRASAEQPLRVLLAEDSPIVRQRLIALINGLNLPIRIVAAADGTDALRLFEETRPEVAVLDIALPGTNGFDLLAAIKTKRPACVVIMLTTYAYPEFRDNAGRMGANFFFSKVREFELAVKVLGALTTSDPAAIQQQLAKP
jgi:DNA-binding NarL/FixJ family response regulator